MMVKEAYIQGFLSKLAQYGIDPSAIYGDYTIDTNDDSGSNIYTFDTDHNVSNEHKVGFRPQKFKLLPKLLPILGRFSYNQYSRHRGGPAFLTFGRRF